MTTQEMIDEAMKETGAKNKLKTLNSVHRILIIRFAAMTVLYLVACALTLYWYDLHLLTIFLIFAWASNLEKTFRK